MIAMMTESLQHAFQLASALPEDCQEMLAAILLEEMESDQKWDRLFAESQDALEKMSEKAMEEHRLGKTRKLDLDAL
jgi:hypothetical protein